MRRTAPQIGPLLLTHLALVHERDKGLGALASPDLGWHAVSSAGVTR